MSDSIDPYQPPDSELEATSPAANTGYDGAEYRPWTRGRTYVVFILGMHAASFMMAFFHPVFAILGFAIGIPTVVVANREIDEIPQAADHPFILWGKRCGKIGLIGGPIVILVWIIIIAVGVGISI
jgi:hypothetical protein